jgi:hypothetical protein
MVEKVARAIRTYGVRIWGAPHLYAVIRGDKWDTPIMSGMTCEIANIEAAKLNARAAIEAMHEPTEAMHKAGNAADCHSGECGSYVTWQAKLAAALKEG